ncbi:hypothetical protein D0962_08890 [Leptolyngbyaceae cyanobacterium CCMR0082]|uniref:SPOR domain-containing protein n=1 Tax=Adonisia turfae CCMR0082 TaxID=2304604 RepID=A0A6M0S3D0_9CYAN|nr:hypothetical protein [Adonisia turfae]NEZ62896.1 hypothetical protein [Adonisia turfae CCMR0082]
MASSSDNTPPPMPPRPGSGPETEIDPQLESVLRNLNVNLEDELTRYRRQRHGRVPPPPPPRRAAHRNTLDLISVSVSTPAAASDAGGTLKQPPTPPPPPPNPFLKDASESSGLEDELPPTLDQLADVDELTSDVAESEQMDADTDVSALSVPANDMPAEGYLESSEELLKSIEEEQADPESVPEPYSPGRKSNILLKLAGLVLVLLAGIGVGFAITSPAQLQKLRSQLWPASETEPVDADTDTTAEGAGDLPEVPASTQPAATAPDPASDGYKPPGPDLSTREFKELDSVEDLVTLDVDGANGSTSAPVTSPLPNPAQSPLPAPGTAAADSQPAVTNNPTTNPIGTETNSAAVPSATPAPATPAPTTTPAPALTTAVTGSNFYVIASYTGDASLTKARELVPDAFVRNFKAGARIQLAAFDNRAQAEEQVRFLTQQGAIVELFGPTNE